MFNKETAEEILKEEGIPEGLTEHEYHLYLLDWLRHRSTGDEAFLAAIEWLKNRERERVS